MAVARERVTATPPGSTTGAEAVAPISTQAPERTFAPLVSLHSSEPVAPMSVDLFLHGSRLFWAFGPGCRADSKQIAPHLTTRAQWGSLGSGGFTQSARCGAGDVYTTSDYTRPYGDRRTFIDRSDLTGREGFYLDLDNPLRTSKLQTATAGGHRVLKPSPVYFEDHAETGDDNLPNVRITYWFFYPFSRTEGIPNWISPGHEGDWERISVLIRRTGVDLWQPLSVKFHRHAASAKVLWKDVLKARDDTGVMTHPRAFVAKGSHGTYGRPGWFSLPVGHDEAKACLRCPWWFTWKPPGMLVDATQEPWYGFGGAWGYAGTTPDSSGPLGPSLRKTLQGRSPSP